MWSTNPAKRKNKRFNIDVIEIPEAKRAKIVQKIAALTYYCKKNNDQLYSPSLPRHVNDRLIEKVASVVNNSSTFPIDDLILRRPRTPSPEENPPINTQNTQ